MHCSMDLPCLPQATQAGRDCVKGISFADELLDLFLSPELELGCCTTPALSEEAHFLSSSSSSSSKGSSAMRIISMISTADCTALPCVAQLLVD